MRESKTKLAELLDAILLFSVLVIALFLFFRTLTGTLNALAAAVAASVTAVKAISRRSAKKKLNFAESKRMNQIYTRLIYAGNQFRLDYFARLLERFGGAEKGADYLTVGRKRVYCAFSPVPLTVSQAVAIYEECVKENCGAVILTPFAPDKDSAAFLSGNKRLKALFGENLYRLIKDNPPELPEQSEAPKEKKFKKLLTAAVDRSLFRRYLFAAVLLLGTSYILPQNILYIAAGSLCLVMSLVCLLNFKSGKQKNSNAIDKKG